ncbi:MAG: hypothetical protein HW411_1674 [Gammaproteobacteria bacterium]|nr:hypothetical protein [Gammaproteobacteria bacterium]
MAAEGLWTVQFSMSEEVQGGLQVEEEINRGGVLVLTGNRLYGGGISFYFIGTYKETSSGITITVNATRYNDIVTGHFGKLNEGRFIFNGTVAGKTMKLQGHVEDNPDKKMYITAEQRVEL